VEWRALGTTAVVAVTDDDALEAARDAVAAEIDALDRACSRFRADSDLSLLNAAGGRPVMVTPLLAEAIRVALRAARLTEGDVDPTVGGSMEAIGYDTDFSAMALEGGSDEAHYRPATGWTGVVITDSPALVTLPAGTVLDLGATAKALGADRAAAAAHAVTGAGVLVGLGGDIAVAGRPPARGWPIHVTDDHAASPEAPGQRAFLGRYATPRTRPSPPGNSMIGSRARTPADTRRGCAAGLSRGVRLKNLGCPPERLFRDVVDDVFDGSANLRVDRASWSW